MSNNARATTRASSANSSSSNSKLDVRSSDKPRKVTARADELDTYMEKLYDEDIESKLDGAKMILQLSEFAGNIEALIQNEALMCLLSRVLNDDYKKSSDFCLTMMRIFWCFSNFLQLHAVLANYRIGAVTLKIVEFEVKRHELRLDEERLLASAAAAATDADAVSKLERDRKRNKKRMKKQDELLVLLNLAEDIHTERKMVKRKITALLAKMLDRVTPELAMLSLAFLKKLSIFEENKDAMVELAVVPKLVRYVRCTNHDKTVQMALKLLFNLSFDPVLRELLVQHSLIPLLVELLKKPPFRALSLRILYHLSIDDRCKSMFTYTDAIPIVMQLVINFPQNVVAKELAALAINLSHNSRNAELMCCQHRGLEALVTRVIRTRDAMLLKVVRNLSRWTLSLQEDAAADTGSANINANALANPPPEKLYKYKGLWAPCVVPLLQLCVDSASDNHALVVEGLGTLANLTPSDLPPKWTWDRIMTEKTALLPFVTKLLVPGFALDDVVLVVVLLVGALALEPKCAPLLAATRLLRTLHVLLQTKQHDTEVTLQVLFAIYRLLRHRETRVELVGLGTTTMNVVPDLLVLMTDTSNGAIRRMGDVVLDYLLECNLSHDGDNDINGSDSDVKQLIRQRRFEIHNAEFLEMVRRTASEKSRGGGMRQEQQRRYAATRRSSEEEDDEKDGREMGDEDDADEEDED